ncbi:hypothetical protein [Bacteroides sedimenti]|uniref:Uncharacterized protein n=1 Tax=Bacteroides sedimenti TaxID=2136147 RepID=A0ABM8I806_9BACE
MVNLDKIRLILNIIFMIGALSTIVVFFVVKNDLVMIAVCFFTIFVKFVEYALRFTQNAINRNKRRNDDD